MELVALSPVPVATTIWQPDAGRFVLTLVCKATFDLLPGEMRLSARQDPIVNEERHAGGDPHKSLLVPSDLVPGRAGVDVTLVGHAYAPGGRPTASVVARMQIGAIDKAIHVIGDRVARPAASAEADGARPAPSLSGTSAPLLFSRMALLYERTAGGPGTSNPVGKPWTERLPNLEPHAAKRRATLTGIAPVHEAAPQPQTAAYDGAPGPLRGPLPHTPAGFGPIAQTWPDRAAKRVVWPSQHPLPAGFDPSFFNAAPKDQRLAHLRPDEALVLEHLHPDHERLVTKLPGLAPCAYVTRYGAEPTRVDLAADALWIDTDRRKATVTWRGTVEVGSPKESGRVLLAMSSASQPFALADLLELSRALVDREAQDAHTARPQAIDLEDEETGEGDDDHLRSTNAWQAPSSQTNEQPGRASQHADDADDDDGEGDDGEDDDDDLLENTADPSLTASVRLPAGAFIPDVAPAWLATPSRRGSAMAGPPFAASAAPVAPPAHRPPPLDLVWDDAAPPDPRSAALDGAPVPSRPAGETTAPFPSLVAAALSAPAAPTTAPPPPLPPPAPPPPPPPAPAPPPPPPAAPPPASLAVPMTPLPTSASRAIGPPPAAPPASMERPPLPQIALERRSPRPAPPRKPLPPPEAVDLLWFDAESVDRIATTWRRLADELDMEPLDPTHDLPAADPVAARDRHLVFGVLTRGDIVELRSLGHALREATDGHGRFTPPVTLVQGDLSLGLDELETLRLTAACAKPLAKDDKKLAEELAGVEELLATPLLSGAPGAADALTRDLVAAVSQSKRPLPVKALREHVERLLLADRKYQIRNVLGGKAIRALVTGAGASTSRDPAVVAYLPEAVAPRLPLSTRVRARLLVEVHPTQDPQEEGNVALRAVAVGRVVPVAKM